MNAFSSVDTAAKALTSGNPESGFNKKAVTSADNSSITGTAAWNADTGGHVISVSQLAAGQTNTGKELKSSDAAAFSKGMNTFGIKSGITTKTVAFTINESDTNKTALDKMANAINKSNSGIKASVISNDKAGTSYLRIDSDKSGTNSSFALTDAAGDAVTAAGANTVTGSAKNAQYTLDGTQYSSQSNTISIDNGKVQITLKKAENKEIRFSIGYDTKAITNNIKTFVQEYSKIADYTSLMNGGTSGGSQFFSGLLFDLLL
ncbi:MAG: hypothetical protein FIA99_10450 [Ruminiclostridium sp.]|nr:hypothetical protein [Ruminiclostridium sp.]